MNMVLKVFLSMSFSGALLILALVCGERFLKHKISRQWQYYIWLIVILRLLLPFGPETNLMGKTYQAVDEAITQNTSLSEAQEPVNAPGNVLPPAVGSEPDNENTNSPVEELVTAHPLKDITSLLINHIWLIWLMVALGMLIRKVTIYQGFIRYINAGLSPVSDMGILDRLSVVAERVGIKKPIELCVNPVHLMSREITKACEFSCDEAVLIKMGYGNAQEYGNTLLDAMAAVGRYKENLGAVTLSENKQLLKERLGAIMKFKEQSRTVKMLTFALTLCVLLGAAFVGIYTMGTSAGNAHAASLPGTPIDTTGKPSLSLDVSSAAVNVLAATDNKISAEYNSDVYSVDINEQGNDWKVSISCKTRTNTNDETIKLYIPDVDYGDVSLSADSGHLTCDSIRSGNIVGDFNMASVFLTLPAGFTGSVDATANSGYFQLISRDDFKNTTTTITDNGDWGEIYKPKDFTENGNTATFTNGTGAIAIQVTRKGSGVMGIYTSDAFDTSNFPDEWGELWKDEWQGKPWEDDWWQNTWQEDDEN